MKQEDAQVPAADGAPVERGVRPRALLLAHKDGRETLHPMREYAVAYRDTAVSEALLYDQAAIAAALDEQRERFAKVCEGLFSPAHSGYGEGYNEALHDCAAAIRGLRNCVDAGHAEGKCGNAQCLRGA